MEDKEKPTTTSSAMESSSPTPEQVLQDLTSLFGFGSSTQGDSHGLNWSSIPWESSCVAPQLDDPSTRTGGTCMTDDTKEEEEEETNCDFSSFPSLSLQKKAKSHGDNDDNNVLLCDNKEGVEAHVASLLARPILVSCNGQRSDDDDEEDDEEESSGFMEESIENVPKVMQRNLLLSFTTLAQSRLRAYATFLARHGISLAEKLSAKELAQEEDDGDRVVGVEQKLERLLGIGSFVSFGKVETCFVAKAAPEDTQKTEDGEDLKVCLPLTMETSIELIIPAVGRDGPQVRTVSIQTTGSITGIFSQTSPRNLLQVVELDLDMHKLLACLKAEAAGTVAHMIDVLNTVHSLPLPHVVPEDYGGGDASKKRPRSTTQEDDAQAVITPDFRSTPPPGHPSDLELAGKGVEETAQASADANGETDDDDDDDDLDSLTPDKCSKIVDSLFDDTFDLHVLMPPEKRARLALDRHQPTCV